MTEADWYNLCKSLPTTMIEADWYNVYKGVYVPKTVYTPESLKYFEEFSFRPDDIVIVTYPKSGTTWMQEIVPQIVSGGDPERVKSIPNWERTPWLEEQKTSKLNLEQWPSPRILTTHFSLHMMPPSFFETKPRIMYVMRNPKDVFTSSFHFHGMASFLMEPGPQSEFLKKFLEGNIMFGSWFDHIKNWLSYEHKDRIFVISYEEMVMDLKGAVSRMAKFLDKPLEAEVIEKIADRCVFKNMKKNNMSNYSLVPLEILNQKKSEFLRKGIVGDWKNLMTVEESDYFDAVYKEKMKDVNYKFIWD